MYLSRVNNNFNPKIRIVDVIRSGTYKQEYTGHGFHIETGKAPKPLGGIWMDLKMVKQPGGSRFFQSIITPTWTGEIDIYGSE